MLQVRGVKYTDGERTVMLWRPKGDQWGHLPIGVLSIVGGATSWGCGNLPDLLPSCSELYQGSGLSMWNHALLAFISQLLKQPDPKLTWEQVSITYPTAYLPHPPPPGFFSSDTNTFNRNTLTTSNVTCNFFPSELTTSTKPLTLFYAFWTHS